jgi:hypothetical protein
MENHQDLFSKLSGEGHNSNNNDNSDPLMRASSQNEDDPFNDSGGDFFDKFLAEEAERNGNSSQDNGSNMFMSGNDSIINVQSMLEMAMNKSSDSTSMDAVNDMEENCVPDSSTNPAFNLTGDNNNTGGNGQAWAGVGNYNTPLSPGIERTGEATQKNWFLPSSATMNPMFDAAPLNVSLGGGSSITSTLRRKGSNAQLNSNKANAVIKANLTSSKLRAPKSEGMLARALKAKYHSGSQLHKYNVNAAGAAALINGRAPRHSMSALLGGHRPNSAIAVALSQNSLYRGGSNSNHNLTAVEEQGSGNKNATWGAVPSTRNPSSSALFANMLSGTSNSVRPNLVSSNSTTSLLRNQQKLSATSGSRSSMQDLLRMCKKQSQTQSLLRQSSARSLLKQTSSQSLKDLSKKVDVSSLLPPQHASGLNGTNHGSSTSGNKNSNNDPSNNSMQPNMDASSLLHQSCRLYPTTAAVVESALRIDPDAVRQAVPVTVENGQSKKPQNIYGYPVNVAITHGGSMEVIQMLVEAGPDVLVQKDGTDGSGSLGIALMSNCGIDIVNLLVQANPECVKVPDRRANYPLHVAVNYGVSLEIVKRLYAMYPKALEMRNFHSETALEIAQRSTRCSEDVMNFLQSTFFTPLESSAHHMEENNAGYLEDGLDDIMETNF